MTTQPIKNPYTFSKDDLLGYCKPLLNIFLIFKYIALACVLIGKTIYAIYKQYCPIITWVEE